jgi:hypothetical protein
MLDGSQQMSNDAALTLPAETHHGIPYKGMIDPLIGDFSLSNFTAPQSCIVAYDVKCQI